MSKLALVTVPESDHQFNFDRIAINWPDTSRLVRAVNVKDYRAKGDGTTDDRQAFVDAIATLPSTGGWVFVPHTADSYVISSAITITKNAVMLVGEGVKATKIKYTAATGFCFDLDAVGFFRLVGLTLDGTGSSGSAGALHIPNGSPRNMFDHVEFANFTGGTAAAVHLDGALDCRFYACSWYDNRTHLKLSDNAAHTYPSNENRFYGCLFQNSTADAADAVHISDSEGNLFDGCVFQGNDSLNTVLVTNTASGNAPGRGNAFRACWFEENGNSQANSAGVKVVGSNSTTHRVESTVIRDCLFFSSFHDNPTRQISLTNSKHSVVDGCYSNLGSPNVAVYDGGANNDTHVTDNNNFAGAKQLDGNPRFRVTKSGAQTITAGNPGADTLITFDGETFDTNSNFDLTAERFTPTVAGKYRLVLHINYENADDQIAYHGAIFKNGAVYERVEQRASGTGQFDFVVSVEADANGSTDYFDCYAQVSGLGANNRNVGIRTTFSGELT